MTALTPDPVNLERVARAICRAGITGPRDHLEAQEAAHWRKFVPEAKAAIEAIRGVTPDPAIERAAKEIGDEIDTAMDAYLNCADTPRKAVLGDELSEILWNNKAGILACLRAIAAQGGVRDARVCPPGHVLMPKSIEEARMMNLISEHYLRAQDGDCVRTSPLQSAPLPAPPAGCEQEVKP